MKNGRDVDSGETPGLLDEVGCHRLDSSWHNRGFKKLVICTERHTPVIDASVALANAVIIIRRPTRRAWPTCRDHVVLRLLVRTS